MTERLRGRRKKMPHVFTRTTLAIIGIAGGSLGLSACEAPDVMEMEHERVVPLANYYIPITNKQRIAWTFRSHEGTVKRSGATMTIIECIEGPLSVFMPDGTYPTNLYVPDISGAFAPVEQEVRNVIGASRAIPKEGVGIPSGETWRVKAQGMEHDSSAVVYAIFQVWDNDVDVWMNEFGNDGMWLVTWKGFSWQPKPEDCHDQGGSG